MPQPANFFRTLSNVTVHYDRFLDPQFGYGTRGKTWTFHCEAAFQNKLRACFSELWDVCPLGRAEMITSAGTYVDKPGSHGLGRAFDLDAIFWSNRTFITLNYPVDKAFYLAVESVFRKYFGTVLNYEYNTDHRDHLHVDDLTPVGFDPTHRSRVLYLQMILTHLFDRPVDIDGIIGSQTNGAVREFLIDAAFASPADVASNLLLHSKLNEVWVDLLDLSAAEGFAQTAQAAKNPLELIESLYEVIGRELDGLPERKRVETAVTTFVNHPEAAAFFDQYRP
ncbi:MAG: extensin family protein [Rhodothermales bacterium]